MILKFVKTNFSKLRYYWASIVILMNYYSYDTAKMNLEIFLFNDLQ